MPVKHTLVTGHSGAGKSTLARSFGLPIYALDDDPDIRAQLDRQMMYAKGHGGRLPDDAPHRRAMRTAEARALSRALSLGNPHVIDGSYLLNRDPTTLRAHALHLVDPPHEQVLDQRVERQRVKDIARGRPWDDARAAGVRLRGQQLINEYEPGAARWRASPYVTKHRRHGMNKTSEHTAAQGWGSGEKTAEVEYRGHTFPGYNQPVRAGEGQHKMMVLAKKGDDVRLVRFGHRGYEHNYSPEAKANYLKRSAGIRDGSGNLTKDNKLSANYWARKHLWPKNQKADGSALRKEASMNKAKKGGKSDASVRARIALIRASQGGNESVSNMIANVYAEELRRLGHDVDEIDLKDVPYADDWDEKYKHDARKRLAQSHATVFATPVYNWGPSARLNAYVQQAVKSGSDPYRPYGVLGAAGSSRSQGYLHSLQNSLAMEDKGINVGAPIVATENDAIYDGDVVKGISPAHTKRLQEHAAELGYLAHMRARRKHRSNSGALRKEAAHELLRKHLRAKTAAALSQGVFAGAPMNVPDDSTPIRSARYAKRSPTTNLPTPNFIAPTPVAQPAAPVAQPVTLQDRAKRFAQHLKSQGMRALGSPLGQYALLHADELQDVAQTVLSKLGSADKPHDAIEVNGKYYRPKVQTFMYDKRGRILASKSQAKGLRAYDNYKFPGGGIEPNEDVLDAARKELLEEAGYTPGGHMFEFGERTPVDWDPSFREQAAKKGRGAYHGQYEYYVAGPLGKRDTSRFGSEGDEMTGLELVSRKRLHKALTRTANDPKNEYGYFDKQKLVALGELEKALLARKVRNRRK